MVLPRFFLKIFVQRFNRSDTNRPQLEVTASRQTVAVVAHGITDKVPDEEIDRALGRMSKIQGRAGSAHIFGGLVGHQDWVG
jgi:hypothetical protein